MLHEINIICFFFFVSVRFFRTTKKKHHKFFFLHNQTSTPAIYSHSVPFEFVLIFFSTNFFFQTVTLQKKYIRYSNASTETISIHKKVYRILTGISIFRYSDRLQFLYKMYFQLTSQQLAHTLRRE